MSDSSNDNAWFDVSRDNTKVVFTAHGKGDSDLFLLDLRTNTVTTLTSSDALEMSPAFSHDGKKIAYAALNKSTADSQLVVLSLINNTSRILPSGRSGVSDFYPSFSIDGKTIAFARSNHNRPYSMGGTKWEDWDVYVADPSGKTPSRRITNQKYNDMSAASFSDAHTIVFSAETVINPHDDEFVRSTIVYRVPETGGKPVALTTQKTAREVSVSSDETKAVYISDEKKPYDYEVWLLDLKTGAARQLTHNASYNRLPHFSGDGKQVYFLSDKARTQHYELWRINTDGTGETRIADSRLFSAPLHWKP